MEIFRVSTVFYDESKAQVYRIECLSTLMGCIDFRYVNNNRPASSEVNSNEERQNLQSYYRDIVEEITNHQRDRVHSSDQNRSRMPRHSDTLTQINSVYPAVPSVSQHNSKYTDIKFL